MSYRFPKLLFVSILMNIIMLAMLSGIAWYKREKIKTKSENFFASLIYKNDKSINSQKYEKEINSDKRYVAIGFDDFRDSDFSMVMPLLKSINQRQHSTELHGMQVLRHTNYIE